MSELEMLSEAVARVRELHKPVPMMPGIEESPVCDGCENPGRFVSWPCPTVAALDGAPEPEVKP